MPVIASDRIDTQRIGRMGELVVELELIARGWHVGNFNTSTGNSAGWDIFAARDGCSVKIRVKAKRPTLECFRWSAKKDSRILVGLDERDPTDFVAAVSFESGGSHRVFIVPSTVVERELRANHETYLAAPKRDGGARKDTAQRNLYIDTDMERVAQGATVAQQFRQVVGQRQIERIAVLRHGNMQEPPLKVDVFQILCAAAHKICNHEDAIM